MGRPPSVPPAGDDRAPAPAPIGGLLLLFLLVGFLRSKTGSLERQRVDEDRDTPRMQDSAPTVCCLVMFHPPCSRTPMVRDDNTGIDLMWITTSTAIRGADAGAPGQDWSDQPLGGSVAAGRLGHCERRDARVAERSGGASRAPTNVARTRTPKGAPKASRFKAVISRAPAGVV